MFAVMAGGGDVEGEIAGIKKPAWRGFLRGGGVAVRKTSRPRRLGQ